MKDLSPIVMFVYNRADLAQKTIESLQKNDIAKDSILYIFSDGAKTDINISAVDEVRTYLKKVDGFKDIIIKASSGNNGLGKSIISGVTEILTKHSTAIVMEDDLLSSPDFLSYTNESLLKYEKVDKIYSTSGYFPPIAIGSRNLNDVCFIPRISSLGWGIWKDRWEKNDWRLSAYGRFIKNNKEKKAFSRAGRDMLQMLINQVEGNATAWAIRCDFNRFLCDDKLTVYPCISKIHHIGNDGRGTNTPVSSKLDVELGDGSIRTILKDFTGEDVDIVRNFHRFYNASLKSELVIILRRMGLYKYIKK